MVMAVSFERYGRLYYLDAGDLTVRVGDKVLVPTDDGTEVAECVWAPQWVDDEIGGLPRLAGIATDADLTRDETNRRRRAEARGAAEELGRQENPPTAGGGGGGRKEAGQAARPADEGRRGRLPRPVRSASLHGLLLRPPPRRLPRAGSGHVKDTRHKGGATPGRRP